MNKETVQFATGIVVLITLIICFPLVTIWAINTLLFPVFSITYSFSTWLAMLIINYVLMGSTAVGLSRIANKI
jgi:hypothetical protein